MQKREACIQHWFDMWLQQKDFGISELFAEEIVYIKSLGFRFDDLLSLQHKFFEWNPHGKVLI